MVYELTPLKEIDFGATGIEAKKQTIRFILATIKNTCVMDREIGWIPDIDMPNEYIKSTMSVKIIEASERKVPGAKVENVSFTEDMENASIKPKVKVVIEDGEV